MLAGLLALVVAAIFAGAAFYVGFAEHRARMALDDRAALLQWKPAYEWGALMQASLAVVGFILGLIAWWQTGAWQWLVGALLLIANWPYTLIIIMPTNNRLKTIDAASAGTESRILLEQWGRLHAVRTALGIASTLAFLWAAMRVG
jgi:hypothetical protein